MNKIEIKEFSPRMEITKRYKKIMAIIGLKGSRQFMKMIRRLANLRLLYLISI
jgi:hypothetical protein